MTSVVEGVVKNVGERKTGIIGKGKRKGQKWDKRSVMIDSTWYGGFANKDTIDALNDVEEGFTVKMDVVEDGEYHNFKSFEIVSRSISKKEVSEDGSESNNYQFRQTYGFAAGRALTFVSLLFDTLEDPVKAGLLPKAEKKQVEAVELLVEKYTNLFADQAWNAWPEEKDEEDYGEEDSDDDEYE